MRRIYLFVRDYLTARAMGASITRYGRVYCASVPRGRLVSIYRLGDGAVGREIPPVLVRL